MHPNVRNASSSLPTCTGTQRACAYLGRNLRLPRPKRVSRPSSLGPAHGRPGIPRPSAHPSFPRHRSELENRETQLRMVVGGCSVVAPASRSRCTPSFGRSTNYPAASIAYPATSIDYPATSRLELPSLRTPHRLPRHVDFVTSSPHRPIPPPLPRVVNACMRHVV